MCNLTFLIFLKIRAPIRTVSIWRCELSNTCSTRRMVSRWRRLKTRIRSSCRVITPLKWSNLIFGFDQSRKTLCIQFESWLNETHFAVKCSLSNNQWAVLIDSVPCNARHQPGHRGTRSNRSAWRSRTRYHRLIDSHWRSLQLKIRTLSAYHRV